MKIKFKRSCSTISTKRTITSDLVSLNIKETTTRGVGNPGPRVGSAQIVAGLNLIIGSPTEMQI